jgi:hypothetical protein
MVGTDVDGQLIAPPARAGSAIRFAVATPADDAAIRRLLRETPMRGAISLSFEREPDYFLGANVGGANDDVIVAYDGHQLACFGRCSTRNAWINGAIRRVGYLAELRLASNASGRFDILRDGYRFFHSRRAVNPADVYFTSIAEDNERARRLLERGLPGLPRYTHVGNLTTLVISTRRLVSWSHGGRPPCLPGSASPEQLATFLNDAGSRHQFAAVWTPETLRGMARQDLPLESFGVLQHDGEIVASAALWDQRRFRQTVVHAYAPLPAHARPLINVFARVLGYPSLPKTGGVLSHAFLSPLAIRAGYEHVLLELVPDFCRRAADRGIDFLTLALPSDDSRLRSLQRRFRTRAYRSRIYRVEWRGMPEFSPDHRNVLPDVALL